MKNSIIAMLDQDWDCESMGLFDSIYAEIDCPSCGENYRYTPPNESAARNTLERIKNEYQEYFDNPNTPMKDFLFFGIEDIPKYIKQINSQENIDEYRNRKYWGLAEIQTKDFDPTMSTFYVGDTISDSMFGHYFAAGNFYCRNCKKFQDAWIEIDNYKILGVQFENPE